jgi:hypothetical protein
MATARRTAPEAPEAADTVEAVVVEVAAVTRW